MRIAITGSRGMLGQALVTRLSRRHQVIPLTRHNADITKPKLVAQAIECGRPDVVLHAAAFTAVDECELHPALAFRVNGEGTLNIAQSSRKQRLRMVYISTDYVFDGEKAAPYTEDDVPNPINVYGRTKLEGEKHVRDLVEHFCIVRASWLFGPHGKNFVGAILEQARRTESLRVVSDQVGVPTYTIDLAEMLEYLIERESSGVYHVTNQGSCSWFEFAEEIVRQAGLCHVGIYPICSSASGRPARRPRNSRLRNARLEAESAVLLPVWQDALRRYLLR